jgi:hypothetical protein
MEAFIDPREIPRIEMPSSPDPNTFLAAASAVPSSLPLQWRRERIHHRQQRRGHESHSAINTIIEKQSRRDDLSIQPDVQDYQLDQTARVD